MGETHAIQRPMLSPHARYRWDPIRQQHQLVFPEGVLVLNPSSAAIITRCNGRSLGELVEELDHEFLGESRVDDVVDFLLEMMSRGVVYDAEQSD